MNSNKYILLTLLAYILTFVSCEKEWVVIEEYPEDIVITDTVYTVLSVTINDTIKKLTNSYFYTTSRTEDAIDDASFTELNTSDLKYRPNGREEYLGVFAWTNISGGESSFDGRYIIRFNELSLLSQSVIIDSVFITLFVVPPTTSAIHGPYGNNGIRMHLVNDSWEEFEVSWATIPDFSEDIYLETDTISASQDSIREDITAMVQQMIETTNQGLLIKSANEHAPLSSVRFFSSEYSEPKKRPYLTVYYREK